MAISARDHQYQEPSNLLADQELSLELNDVRNYFEVLTAPLVSFTSDTTSRDDNNNVLSNSSDTENNAEAQIDNTNESLVDYQLVDLSFSRSLDTILE